MTRKEYDQYVDKYADGLFRFLRNYVAIRGKEEDIIQEVFEKMWRNKETLNTINLKSYLESKAYWLMMNEIKRSRRIKEIPRDYVEPAIDHDMEAFNRKEILDEALDLLSVEQRTVVLLRDQEGYDYDQIAQIMEISYENVRQHIRRARKIMKTFLIDPDNLI